MLDPHPVKKRNSNVISIEKKGVVSVKLMKAKIKLIDSSNTRVTLHSACVLLSNLASAEFQYLSIITQMNLYTQKHRNVPIIE